MKLNFLRKVIPFTSTLVIILFLYINNQKVNTKLRILIWNTPSYSLGTYLATSTGIGFVLSYILTTNLANINRLKFEKSLKYKHDNKKDSNQYKDSYFRVSEEKTLIERDISEPSPTVDAQFRVIGKTERYDTDDIDYRIKYDNGYEYDNGNEDDNGNEYDYSYSERGKQNESVEKQTQKSSDWNDDSFSTW